MNRNNLDPQYINLVKDILDKGSKKGDRTGTGTVSVFGKQVRHNMSDGFPLLTTKKMSLKNIATELIWFLNGDTNIKYLLDNGCYIWVGDCYKHYLKSNWKLSNTPDLSKEQFIDKIKTDPKFCKKWGDLGPIYGRQWRDWGGYTSDAHQKMNGEVGVHIKGIDQLKNSIELLKTDPDSRRNIISSWNVEELENMTLPPCHNFFQFYTRELTHQERCELFGHNDDPNRKTTYPEWLDNNGYPKRTLSLMWNQRSVDTGLGLPYNIASYGLLLEIVGKIVNMVPDELVGNLGDTHVYSNHVEPIQEQLGREGFGLPKLNFSEWFNNSILEKQPEVVFNEWIESLKSTDFILENYQFHPSIDLPLSN